MKSKKTDMKLALTRETLKNLTVRTNLRAGDPPGCTNNTTNGTCGSGDSTGGPGVRHKPLPQ